MKKTYLFTLILGLNLLGCGGNKHDSRPASDGKGDIDVSAYLPAKAMTKNFTFLYYRVTFYGGEGYQNITIENNKVYIEQHAHGSAMFNVGDVMQKKEMTYTDNNITNFFSDSAIAHYMPKSTYRYINLKELLSNDSEIKSHDLDNGKRITESSHECYYKSITDTITNRYDEIIENDGDFLVVECDIKTKETYNIDKEYRDVDDRNGKFDYTETKYLAYYKKGVGIIYVEAIDKTTTKPCKKINSCQYSDIPSGYGYHVKSIDYN